MKQTNRLLIDKLHQTHTLSRDEWIHLITNRTPEDASYLFALAREVRHHHYGHGVYIRGLIELQTTVKTTAITAAFKKATAMCTATVSLKRRYSPAAGKAIPWGSALSYSRGVRTAGSQMTAWYI